MNKNLKTTLSAWPATVFATIAVSFATGAVARCLGIDIPDQPQVQEVRMRLLRMFECPEAFVSGAVLLAWVLAAVPFLEEFIFRFLLFRVPLWSRWRRPDAALADARAVSVACVSSAAFSAAHYIVQPFPDNAFIALFFFGLVQCLLYRKTGRLWCPMLNHCLFNLTNLALALLFPEM